LGGGLEFRPTVGSIKETTYEVQLDELVDHSNKALPEKTELNLPIEDSKQGKEAAVEQIILVGTSAVGARAKAVIAWNQKTNVIKTG
jgi:serine/threonine-protein kinase HipA